MKAWWRGVCQWGEVGCSVFWQQSTAYCNDIAFPHHADVSVKHNPCFFLRAYRTTYGVFVYSEPRPYSSDSSHGGPSTIKTFPVDENGPVGESVPAGAQIQYR